MSPSHISEGEPESELSLEGSQYRTSLPKCRGRLVPLETEQVGGVEDIEHLPQHFDVLGFVYEEPLAQSQIRVEKIIAPLGMDTHPGRTVVSEPVAVVVSTSRLIVGWGAVGRNNRAHVYVERRLIYQVSREPVADIVLCRAEVYVSKLVVRVGWRDTDDYRKTRPG